MSKDAYSPMVLVRNENYAYKSLMVLHDANDEK